MDDFALTPAERALLEAPNARDVRYLVIGLGAAVLQGAPVSTQNIDLWFEHPGDDAVRAAAAAVGGVWIAGSDCTRQAWEARAWSGLTPC